MCVLCSNLRDLFLAAKRCFDSARESFERSDDAFGVVDCERAYASEAKSKEDVIAALGKALSPLITLSVQEGIKKQLDGLTSTVRELKADNDNLKFEIETLRRAKR